MKNRFLMLLMIISIAALFAACTNNDKGVQTSARTKGVSGLYPAYIMEGSEKKWGYINEEGKFIIEPKYEMADDFKNNGMAVVLENGNYRLIDESGKSIMTSQYFYTYDFSEKSIVVSDGSGKSYLLDEKGQILFQTDGSIGELSYGKATFSKKIDKEKTLWGYINAQGKVVIEPRFQWAQAFSEDNAIVQDNNGEFGIINREGLLIMGANDSRVDSLYEGIFVFSKANEGNREKYGYMKLDGNIMLDAVYSDAQAFGEDGLAIVNATKDYGNEYGVIDKTGKFVIPPEYARITSLGNGIYAVPKTQEDFYDVYYAQKALFDKTGKQLTEFKYYDLERLENGRISATDDKNTYLIDDKGNEVSSIPKAEGIGSIKLCGKLYKVEVDNELYYLSQAGKTLWKSDNTIRLEDGLEVKMKTFRPDRCLLIQYPEISGLSDSKVQYKINELLKDKFIAGYKASNKDGEMYTELIEVSFTVDKNKDLLTVNVGGYYYPIGAAHGQPIREDYHINLKNGNLYTLKDLFKDGSKYKEKLTEVIKRMIAKINVEYGGQVYSEDIGDFEENGGYVIQKNSLNIYFYPYAIASYAAGFPEFDINYDELMDYINTSGELWNSFNRDSSVEAKKTVNEIDPSDRTEIEKAMKYYENTMVEAINKNDFKLVEPWLYPESSLYTSQKKLVADLNMKQIKERLDGYSIENIELDDLGTVYRVYIKENIGIQYPGKDYTTKQFNWVYSLRYSYEDQKYQLTYIDKWEKK